MLPTIIFVDVASILSKLIIVKIIVRSGQKKFWVAIFALELGLIAKGHNLFTLPVFFFVSLIIIMTGVLNIGKVFRFRNFDISIDNEQGGVS
jgi:hypothetical protein